MINALHSASDLVNRKGKSVFAKCKVTSDNYGLITTGFGNPG